MKDIEQELKSPSSEHSPVSEHEVLRILVGRLREVWLYNEHSQNRHCPETRPV